MKNKDLIQLIGQNIKRYRKQNKNNFTSMTIKELSNLTNIPYSYIKKLEKGNIKDDINIQDIYKISKVLNIPISKFLEKSND